MGNFEKTWEWVLKIGAACGGAIGGAMGGWDTVLIVLCYMMAIDYATGWACAVIGKSPKTDGGKLDSHTSWVGLLKKAVMLLVVFMASQMDRIMPQGTQVFRDAMAMFYVANEGLSVVENLAIMGVPFPKFIQHALEQLKAKSDEAEGGE